MINPLPGSFTSKDTLIKYYKNLSQANKLEKFVFNYLLLEDKLKFTDSDKNIKDEGIEIIKSPDCLIDPQLLHCVYFDESAKMSGDGKQSGGSGQVVGGLTGPGMLDSIETVDLTTINLKTDSVVMSLLKFQVDDTGQQKSNPKTGITTKRSNTKNEKPSNIITERATDSPNLNDLNKYIGYLKNNKKKFQVEGAPQGIESDLTSLKTTINQINTTFDSITELQGPSTMNENDEWDKIFPDKSNCIDFLINSLNTFTIFGKPIFLLFIKNDTKFKTKFENSFNGSFNPEKITSIFLNILLQQLKEHT